MPTDTTTARPIHPLDLHGPSWRKWIEENVRRGCAPQRMVQDMIKSVWSADDAVKAITVAFQDQNRGLPPTSLALPRLPESSSIRLGGKKISILSRFSRPSGGLLSGVVTPNEGKQLIDLANQRGLFDPNRQSRVVDPTSGGSVENTARTSTSIHFGPSEFPILCRIEERLSRLTSWPVENGEGIQILRYLPGQQYKAHFDWFDPQKPGSAIHLKRGGQRVATTIVFLACAEEGGETSFPTAGIRVSPPFGGAVFFRNVDILGQTDSLSLHAGNPVVQGEKIVLTYWQREGVFINSGTL